MAKVKNLGGRPRLPYRTRPVSVRIKEEEHRKLIILANHLDTTVGGVLRMYGVDRAVGVFDRSYGEDAK